MEISSHEGEIPIPINSVYGHMIHHHHHHNNNNNNIIPCTNSGTQQVITIPSPPPPPPPPTTNGLEHHDHHNIIHSNNNNIVHGSRSYEKSAVKYRECLKNHAAAMGGNATDGCGEFMPSGEEGSLEALICLACNCHRNFHRKEVQGKLFLGHHHPNALMYSSSSRAAPTPPHQQMIMPYTAIGPHLASESDEHDHHHHHHHHQQVVKKRFRTKFTQEQKEKMLRFAERVGWKIQKEEEGVVQQLCQEIGIKRRVLKVWMHNNKTKKAIVNPSSTSTA